MKRTGICLWMMLKRMGKHPVYWILLLLFPAAIFAVPRFNTAAEENRIPVGYVIVETEREAAEAETPYAGRPFTMLLESALEDEENIFEYIKYADEKKLREDIITGKLSCGVFFDGEFSERLEEQDYRHCITLYLPEGMNVGGMVQEDIFRRVYQACSAVWYAELLGEQGCQIKPEEVLQKFSEYQKEGKVFKVDYEVRKKGAGKSSGAAENTGNMQGAEADASDTTVGERDVSVLSLRSVLAFLTLLSASLGALDAGRDRKRKLGEGIGRMRKLRQRKIFQENAKHSRNACAPVHAIYMASAGAPILPAVLFLAGGMLFYNAGMAGAADGFYQAAGSVQLWILPEIISALLYGLVLWLFAMLAGRFIPVKLLEGIMPCFLLAVLLCCPVFFDPGETIPLFGHLSKVFPITWYLRFWG